MVYFCTVVSLEFAKTSIYISTPHENHTLDIKTERGLYSFYRLIAAAYFSKHCSAFQPITSPKALLDSLHQTNTQCQNWL
jgi:hypothetical protein